MHKLSGVFAANVTPFDPATLAIVPGWMSRHLAFLRVKGCNGIVPMGTNGEGPSMSLDERKAVIDIADGRRIQTSVHPFRAVTGAV